jgi:hypothetical protein
MNIKLYYNTSDNRYINKTLSSEFSISGSLKDETSLLSPIITIKNDAVLRYNYAYIPEFKRYYYIVGVESVRSGLWRLYLQVDPLMSFKADILSLKVVVNKQSDSSNGDEYIDDGSLVTDNQIFKNVYNFPNGFNDNGEYILITAG